MLYGSVHPLTITEVLENAQEVDLVDGQSSSISIRTLPPPKATSIHAHLSVHGLGVMEGHRGDVIDNPDRMIAGCPSTKHCFYAALTCKSCLRPCSPGSQSPAPFSVYSVILGSLGVRKPLKAEILFFTFF